MTAQTSEYCNAVRMVSSRLLIPILVDCEVPVPCALHVWDRFLSGSEAR